MRLLPKSTLLGVQNCEKLVGSSWGRRWVCIGSPSSLHQVVIGRSSDLRRVIVGIVAGWSSGGSRIFVGSCSGGRLVVLGSSLDRHRGCRWLVVCWSSDLRRVVVGVVAGWSLADCCTLVRSGHRQSRRQDVVAVVVAMTGVGVSSWSVRSRRCHRRVVVEVRCRQERYCWRCTSSSTCQVGVVDWSSSGCCCRLPVVVVLRP